MKVLYDDNTRSLVLQDEEKKMVFHFVADEFAVEFKSSKKIVINKQNNEQFYNIISSFMSNNYVLNDNGLSSKTATRLEWLSDEYGDLEDNNETQFMTRLVIEIKDDNIELYEYKPFYQKNNINKPLVTLFSTGGNGRYNYNIKTRNTLQNDFVKEITSYQNEKRINYRK